MTREDRENDEVASLAAAVEVVRQAWWDAYMTPRRMGVRAVAEWRRPLDILTRVEARLHERKGFDPGNPPAVVTRRCRFTREGGRPRRWDVRD